MRSASLFLLFCEKTPFQQAGLGALALPNEYHEQIRAEYSARRDILLSGLTEVGMTYREPEGAYYLMADCAPLGWKDDWAFAEHMAREVGVTAVPGSSFYHGPGKRSTRLRFNFAKQRDTLEEGVRRLQQLRKT